ncbi:XdhC family protein [Novosphingobium bradum]|uniref:XdhC family protein n=1 Tax=Novosphingobium bradum TaxID=1737444 RepID=A0ABV7ING5_9SPHN
MTAAPPCDEDQAALRLALAVPGTALCTIVGIDGSYSRRRGAQLAVAPDGRMAGSLADGCLERELATRARQAWAEGSGPVLLRFGAGSPFIDFRLPCGAGIDVLLDPAPDRADMAAALARLDARQPAALPLPAPSPLAERRFLPSLRLVVLGAGPEPEALVRLAQAHGLGAALLAPERDLALGRAPDLALDAWSAVVLLFHDHEWEPTLADWALRSPACYIGAQGGKTAREARAARLAAMGHDAANLARLHSPVGLIPHARDAATLALSILAEVVATYEHLRD